MKPILVSEIRKLINGELIRGREDWTIKVAVEYDRHKIRTRRTLIFVRKNQEIDWIRLRQLEPYAIITDKSPEQLEQAGSGATLITVKNLREAFWSFVKYYRDLFSIPIVAITGTCGKTTTREMIKHILDEGYHVQSTINNLNEPKRSFIYLQGIDETTDMGVFETGLGNPGNLTYHCMIYRPTIGIITTIGIDHLEHCKTLDGYIKAKSEIVDGLDPDNGILILNADCENTKKVSLHQFKGKVVYFGIYNDADILGNDLKYTKNGMEFVCTINGMKYPIFVPGHGEHQVYNALAAIAAIHEMGIGITTAGERLRYFQNMERHLETVPGINGSTIIDDSWSTNPTSIKAALDVLEHVSKDKKTIVLLGDIQQLGNDEVEIHSQLGDTIAGKNIDVLITIGPLTSIMANQAKNNGYKGKVITFSHIDEEFEAIFSAISGCLDENSTLLIKGSRFNKSMLKLADQLKKEEMK